MTPIAELGHIDHTLRWPPLIEPKLGDELHGDEGGGFDSWWGTVTFVGDHDCLVQVTRHANGPTYAEGQVIHLIFA